MRLVYINTSRMRCLFYLLIVILLKENVISEFKQEAAKIHMCNPKYMTNCYAITRRVGRGLPYRSNVTGVLMQPWGNNVTMRILFKMRGVVEVMRFESKICDALKLEWFRLSAITFTNRDGSCPLAAGPIGVYNLILPPKNIPEDFVDLLRNLGHERIYALYQTLLTDTKEVITEGSMIIFI